MSHSQQDYSNPEERCKLDRELSMQALLAEFDVLRAAIRARVDASNKCLFFAYTTVGVVVTLAIQSSNLAILITIPFVLPVFYLNNSDHETHIRFLAHYIQNDLGNQIRSIANNKEVIQFESRIERARDTGQLVKSFGRTQARITFGDYR